MSYLLPTAALKPSFEDALSPKLRIRLRLALYCARLWGLGDVDDPAFRDVVNEVFSGAVLRSTPRQPPHSLVATLLSSTPIGPAARAAIAAYARGDPLYDHPEFAVDSHDDFIRSVRFRLRTVVAPDAVYAEALDDIAYGLSRIASTRPPYPATDSNIFNENALALCQAAMARPVTFETLWDGHVVPQAVAARLSEPTRRALITEFVCDAVLRLGHQALTEIAAFAREERSVVFNAHDMLAVCAGAVLPLRRGPLAAAAVAAAGDRELVPLPSLRLRELHWRQPPWRYYSDGGLGVCTSEPVFPGATPTVTAPGGERPIDELLAEIEGPAATSGGPHKAPRRRRKGGAAAGDTATTGAAAELPLPPSRTVPPAAGTASTAAVSTLATAPAAEPGGGTAGAVTTTTATAAAASTAAYDDGAASASTTAMLRQRLVALATLSRVCRDEAAAVAGQLAAARAAHARRLGAARLAIHALRVADVSGGGGGAETDAAAGADPQLASSLAARRESLAAAVAARRAATAAAIRAERAAARTARADAALAHFRSDAGAAEAAAAVAAQAAVADVTAVTRQAAAYTEAARASLAAELAAGDVRLATIVGEAALWRAVVVAGAAQAGGADDDDGSGSGTEFARGCRHGALAALCFTARAHVRSGAGPASHPRPLSP